jgi:hypothetical protein
MRPHLEAAAGAADGAGSGGRRPEFLHIGCIYVCLHPLGLENNDARYRESQSVQQRASSAGVDLRNMAAEKQV